MSNAGTAEQPEPEPAPAGTSLEEPVHLTLLFLTMVRKALVDSPYL